MCEPVVLTTSIPLPENKSDYHSLIKCGEKLYLFNKQFHDQPTYNWGQRVLHKGGYVCVFDLEKNEWEETINYGPITECENTDELTTVHNGAIHVLLFTNFGTINFKGLYKWTGTCFEELPLENNCQIIESNNAENKPRVSMFMAEGDSGEARYIISNMSGHRLHKLDLSTGCVEDIMSVNSDECFFGNGKPLMAFVRDTKVIISYGVMMCSFKWVPCSLVQCDLEEKTSTAICTRDGEEQPPFMSGASLTATCGSLWYHIAGDVLVGMCDSRFEGSTYVLDTEALEWKKMNLEIDEGTLEFGASDGKTIYIGSKNGISIVTVDV